MPPSKREEAEARATLAIEMYAELQSLLARIEEDERSGNLPPGAIDKAVADAIQHNPLSTQRLSTPLERLGRLKIMMQSGSFDCRRYEQEWASLSAQVRVAMEAAGRRQAATGVFSADAAAHRKKVERALKSLRLGRRHHAISAINADFQTLADFFRHSNVVVITSAA